MESLPQWVASSWLPAPVLTAVKYTEYGTWYEFGQMTFALFPLPLLRVVRLRWVVVYFSCQNAMDEVSDDFDVFGVYYVTSRSTDDALSESVSGEIYLFMIACKRTAESLQIAS